MSEVKEYLNVNLDGLREGVCFDLVLFLVLRLGGSPKQETIMMGCQQYLVSMNGRMCRWFVSINDRSLSWVLGKAGDDQDAGCDGLLLCPEVRGLFIVEIMIACSLRRDPLEDSLLGPAPTF